MNYKKILTGMAAVVAVAFGFTACSENVEVNNNANNNETLSIGVSVHQGWNDDAKTRSARRQARINEMLAAGAERVIKTEGAIKGEPIYMWCDEMDGISGKGHSVDVASEMESAESTRGTLMSGHDGSMHFSKNNFVKSTFYNNFSIYGEKAQDGTAATWKHDNEWTVSKAFTWTDDEDYFFSAIAPVNATGVSNATTTGFSFTTPEKSTDQVDVMVGHTPFPAKRTDREMLFNFNHAMTAIKFKLGSKFASGYKVTRLELYNIYKKNTYTFGSGWGTPNTKFLSSVTTDFSTTGGTNKMITNDGTPNETVGTTFLVLPQDLPDDAYAIVTLVEEGKTEEQYLSAQLRGLTPKWLPGHTYTYVLSSNTFPSDYHFTIEGGHLEFTHMGDATSVDQFKVESYNSKTGEPVAWEIDGYMLQNADGTWPDTWQSSETTMLNSLSATSGAGGDAGDLVTTSIKPQTPNIKRVVRRQDVLRDPSRPTKTNFDLSIHKLDNSDAVINRSTANSYIVRYAGTYKIPLVVGNSIQNGVAKKAQDYTSANNLEYKFSNGEPNPNIIWKYGYNIFTIYNGNVLTAANGKITGATNPEIVWHDFCDPDNSYSPLTNVITDLSITTEGDFQFLNFAVNPATIQQGNAVLAVKDGSGKIMWSWHIYITDTDWTKTSLITNFAGVDFNLAPENLGYVDEVTTNLFEERMMKIRVRQAVSEETAEVTIKQLPHVTRALHHWDTKYQWGRKDAFPGLDDELSPYYTGTKTFGHFTNYYESIQKPFQWGTSNGYGSWYGEANSSVWLNVWSAQQTKVIVNNNEARATTTSVKTIFDPSPVGYKVPPPAVFTGMINDQSNTEWTFDGTSKYPTTNKEKTNIKGEYDGEGWNFYCDGEHDVPVEDREPSGTFFMPSTGKLNNAGNTLDGHLTGERGWEGWEWFCVPRMNQTEGGRYTAWNTSYHRYRVRTLPNNPQAAGIAVRPVKE